MKVPVHASQLYASYREFVADVILPSPARTPLPPLSTSLSKSALSSLALDERQLLGEGSKEQRLFAATQVYADRLHNAGLLAPQPLYFQTLSGLPLDGVANSSKRHVILNPKRVRLPLRIEDHDLVVHELLHLAHDTSSAEPKGALVRELTTTFLCAALLLHWRRRSAKHHRLERDLLWRYWKSTYRHALALPLLFRLTHAGTSLSAKSVLPLPSSLSFPAFPSSYTSPSSFSQHSSPVPPSQAASLPNPLLTWVWDLHRSQTARAQLERWVLDLNLADETQVHMRDLMSKLRNYSMAGACARGLHRFCGHTQSEQLLAAFGEYAAAALIGEGREVPWLTHLLYQSGSLPLQGWDIVEEATQALVTLFDPAAPV